MGEQTDNRGPPAFLSRSPGRGVSLQGASSRLPPRKMSWACRRDRGDGHPISLAAIIDHCTVLPHLERESWLGPEPERPGTCTIELPSSPSRSCKAIDCSLARILIEVLSAIRDGQQPDEDDRDSIERQKVPTFSTIKDHLERWLPEVPPLERRPWRTP